MIKGWLFGKRISPGAIANLPHQMKGFDCFCRFHFLPHGLEICQE
jgi:hypothetical protein